MSIRGDDVPYKSEKQRKFLHWKHPKIARRWDEEYGGKPVQKSHQLAVERLRKSLEARLSM